MLKLCAIASALCLTAEAARFNRKSNSTSTGAWKAVKMNGRIEVLRPAFLFLDEAKDQILISSFGKTNRASDSFQWPLPAISQILQLPTSEFAKAFRGRSFAGKYGKEIQFVKDKDIMQWPNKLSRAPAEYGDYIVVPDGFLAPFKGDGSVFLADSKGDLHRITKKDKGYFYHEVEWHDFNGDGLKDILTIRAKKKGAIPGQFETGDLLWLENPGKAGFEGQWKEHSIAKGPDVIFKSIPYKGGLAVFCTQAFNPEGQKISVHLVNFNGEQTASRVIDDTIGLPFAVTLADLDVDGVKDLLVTNHQDDSDEVKCAIYAYEVPWDDLIGGEFKRHTLVYHPSMIKRNDPGVGAPGFAYAFYPKKGMTGPMHIIAAGDGNFDVWYLTPTGNRFEYNTQLVDFDGTTGELLLHDFDKDGIMDVLIPDNDEWSIQGITFTQS